VADEPKKGLIDFFGALFSKKGEKSEKESKIREQKKEQATTKEVPRQSRF
jgi:hypothetical protein